MRDGFVRIAAATPSIRVADCEYNVSQMTKLARQAAAEGVSLLAFPELSVTAYTCGDLFLQRGLLQGAEKALARLCEETADLEILIIAGFPFADGSALYNTAAILLGGKIIGLVPKQNIPNYSEFYEMRHFTPGCGTKTVTLCGQTLLMGTDLIFGCSTMPEFRLGIEICEDLWVPVPPSCRLAAAGATVIVNLSASDEIIGKASYRRSLVNSQSGRLIAAYLYADAGEGESSTDMVFAGHNMISENGAMLAESKRFTTGLTIADVDLQRMESDRRRSTTFPKSAEGVNTICFELSLRSLALRRSFAPHPFVPADSQDLAGRCEEILALQSSGLATRLRHTGSKKVLIGLSGGLDSTLALIVSVHAFDTLGLDRKGIITVNMPCFGTTERTKNNAFALAEAYGVTLKDIPITDSVVQHFVDIGQNIGDHDVTFENGQARERTQVLMDLANQMDGIVVGTGDLSELALGWATYNGDHMSMYGVNSSIPKTLVRYLVKYEADHTALLLQKVLLDVLDTPVSPELLPPVDGVISQKTEELVGPYELHDFFLYYMLRFGFGPRKIFRLAALAFDGVYSPAVIKQWLMVFIRRFFSQQFKRSCLPDGPKVGTVTLSPRGDFRMPSDARSDLWIAEAESIEI